MNIRVRLDVPENEKAKCRAPHVHGEHFGYDGAIGTILSVADKGGAWVCFGEATAKYVGCPVAWLSVIQPNQTASGRAG